MLEKNGSLAQVCVELESQIEMPFELLYWTEDGSATGIYVHQLSIHVCLCSPLYLFDLHSETDFSFSF